MKKVAIVFVVAVLVLSLVLAWLAVRSLRDQQFLLERQQSLHYPARDRRARHGHRRPPRPTAAGIQRTG